MSYKELTEKIRRYHKKLNGSVVEYDLSGYDKLVAVILKTVKELDKKSDKQLEVLSKELRKRVVEEKCLESFLVMTYSLVYEAVKRVLCLEPFNEQLIGAIALHQGKCSQMQTGEGKTMIALFPACLNALTGSGVHVLTFNDYLARRDREWMGGVYGFLGLRTGCVQEGMSIEQRKEAYLADITYCTAKEAGFDYLRDSIAVCKDSIVQRELNFAIVDEADSIMIDEARVPLVIAGAIETQDGNCESVAGLIRRLKRGKEFEFDEYKRNVFLTEDGINQIENVLKCQNLYAEESSVLLSRVNYALHAEYLLQCDKDYIVCNGKIEQVDEFTGRVADKRRWPDGLQAAVEEKEGCRNGEKGHILNSITLQHFLQQYRKLSGMTATAEAAEEEFREFYGLPVVVIPPHEKSIRQDLPDLIFSSKEEKRKMLVEEIVREHPTGRPVLVGTGSVLESLELADALKEKKVDCKVLNAKNDACEARIIADAGRIGAVTVSTNMAGRGTDIKLGGADESGRDAVVKLGGLYVIGTNRHESRRIDNQLRGRAGRQGDPGLTRFFISTEDDLFIRYNLKDLLPKDTLKRAVDNNISKRLLINEISRVQRIVEGQNMEIKITLYKYSLITEQQRKIVHEWRNDILLSDNFPGQSEEWGKSPTVSKQNKTRYNALCKMAALSCLDSGWSRYLNEINVLKDSIHLRRVGGQDPLFEFRKMAITMFDETQRDVREQIEKSLKEINEEDINTTYERYKLKMPSATWTYLVNDDPFEQRFGLQLLGNVGISLGAALLWPITVLTLLMERKKERKNKKSEGGRQQ